MYRGWIAQLVAVNPDHRPRNGEEAANLLQGDMVVIGQIDHMRGDLA